MYLKDLEEVSARDISTVGSEAASLGELTKTGVNVPSGFVLTNAAFQAYLKGTLQPEALQDLLHAAMKSIGADKVTVRLSAIDEFADTSWATESEAYRNIDQDSLLEAVMDCWTTAARAKRQATVAVVVQKMVEPEVAGTLSTVDPIMEDPSNYVVEAVHGMGDLLEQGTVIPDRFVIDKETGEATHIDPHLQQSMLVLEEGEPKEVELPKAREGKPTLNAEQLDELHEAGEQVESYYHRPMELEWAIEKDNLYVVQARPITAFA